jgi:hypothetical protein
MVEVPAHTGFAPNDAALRTLLLAPAPLPLTQWYVGIAESVDRRLEGCSWRIVGTPVPWSPEAPDFPFVDHTDRNRPLIIEGPPPPDYGVPKKRRLQVWLWRVFRVPSPPYPHPLPLGWMRPCVDLRWHPEYGKWFEVHVNSPTEVRIAQAWLRVTNREAGGRPHGRHLTSGARFSWPEVYAGIATVKANRDYPTRDRVWEAMGNQTDAVTLYRWHRVDQGLSWPEVLTRYEERFVET